MVYFVVVYYKITHAFFHRNNTIAMQEVNDSKDSTRQSRDT